MKRVVAILVVLLAAVAPAPAQSAATAYLSRGTQLMQSHLFEEAAAQFKHAIALEPANPRAHFEYAVCLFSLGHNQQARTQFEKVRQLAGKSRYVTYYLGRLDLLSNNYPSAIRRLASVAADPPFPDTAFYLGIAYMSAGNVPQGTKWLERAAQLMPHDYRVHYRLARAYARAGLQQKAAREFSLYSHYLQEQKSTETEVRACTQALRTQPLASARQVCLRIYDPNDPEKLTLLGQLFGDAGAYAEALDPLKRAVQLDPGSFKAWQDLGLTYFRMGQYADARAPLQKAVALRPDYYGSVVLLGATLYMLGDDAAALPVLERAHQLNPSDAQTTAVLNKLRAEHQKR